MKRWRSTDRPRLAAAHGVDLGLRGRGAVRRDHGGRRQAHVPRCRGGRVLLATASRAPCRAAISRSASLRIWGALLSLLVFYAIVRIDFYQRPAFVGLPFADTCSITRTRACATTRPACWASRCSGRSGCAAFCAASSRSASKTSCAASPSASSSSRLPCCSRATSATCRRASAIIAVPYVAVGLLAIGLAHASRASDEFERDFSSTWLMLVGGGVVLLALLRAAVRADRLRDGARRPRSSCCAASAS